MQRLTIVILIVLVGSLFFYNYHRNGVKAESKPVTVTHVSTSAKIAPAITLSANPHWVELLNEYNEYIKQAVENGEAPGAAVAIVKDSSVLFLKGFGLSDAKNKDSVGVFSVFRLGSVSKSLAGVLTARLVQEGVLNWDDKVIKYIPDFELKSKESTEQITLRHLLSHSTGLPYHAFTYNIDNGEALDPLIYHLRDLDLTNEPGKTYSYQNVAYSVIGKVIESATGKPYEVVMAEKIFTPLKMSQASLTFDAMMANDDKALPHVHSLRGWKPTAINSTYYNVGPAGGVNASISDMARWLKALTGHQNTFLNTAVREEMFKPVVRATQRNRYFRTWKKSSGSFYSLGWRVLTFKTDTINYHGGYVNSYRSEIAIKGDDGIGICVLVNSAGQLADRAIPEFFILYEKHREKILEWEKSGTPTLASDSQGVEESSF
ncbi:MAG TPA: serine hydrolase domain-containing protein [Cyclobacteriaceae bacterium]|nr:serine hydrolase domain-containing protein [Cyclobacteriaceae bacterium]